jgi:hypothetical protein
LGSNVVTTGHAFHPAYDYLYNLESYGHPTLGYNPDWSMEDPRYIPQNVGIAVSGMPDLLPRFLPDSVAFEPTPVCMDSGAVRGLFDLACHLEPAARMVTKASLLRAAPALAAGFVAVAAFAAARLALLPGVAFWDTGELQTVGPLLGTAHPTGFPTYVLLGWLASVVLQPFGEPAFRMNLLSALCLAVAAGLTVDLARALTRSTVLGVMAGLGMTLTPVAWSIGTHADAHALHLALLVLLLRLLVAWESRIRESGSGGGTHADRYLVAAVVVFGLGLGNHFLVLLLVPPVWLFVRAVAPAIWRRRRFVLGCAAVLGVTLVAVYLELPLRAGIVRASLVYGRPDTWGGFWYVALGEQFQGSLVDPFGDLPGKFGQLVERTVAQFGPLAPLIPVGFVATAVRRRRYALLTGSAALITCFVAASYENADIGRYYLGPVLMAWTWLAILTRSAVDLLTAILEEQATPNADPGRRPALLGRPSVRSPAGTALAGAVGLALLAPTLSALPTSFATIDESHDRSAVNWVDHALAVMEPDAVIVSWWSYSTPLWYAQRVLGRRPDLAIVDDRTRLDDGLGGLTDVIDANLGLRPVYVIRSDPTEVALLAARYELQPIDGFDAFGLTRVVARREGAS